MLYWESTSIKDWNTFGIDVYAPRVATLRDISDLTAWDKERPFIIGGGSNILFTKDVTEPILRNELKGVRVLKQDNCHVWVKVMSGENWHELVMTALDNGWYGIENLALIPGTVGAAPMQNIGAYGREVKAVIEVVNCWHWEKRERFALANVDCRFGYRDSIFKQELKGKCFIESVVFRLSKQQNISLQYGAIEEQLHTMKVLHPTAQDVARAVMAIRRSKLPDPNVLGNAGSFFKNPTITAERYSLLKESWPDLPAFEVAAKHMKLPAAWLIDQCGWKGYRKGDVGVHRLQALVLVNYGQALGADIYQLSSDILQSVEDKFGITLEREVQVY